MEFLKHFKKNESGIALMMVLSSVTVLAVLATEFVALSQINKKIAYSQVDQIKALYLTKSGFKISLLRLKAYQNLQGLGKKGKQNSSPLPANFSIPKKVIDLLWSFPFSLPLSDQLPGLTLTSKEEIQKYLKETNFDGEMVSTITPETGKMNINLFLPWSEKEETKKNNDQNQPSQPAQPNNPNQDAQKFNATSSKQTLQNYFYEILKNKSEADLDFADQYRDFRLEDLMDQIYAWADKNHESKTAWPSQEIEPKKAPFYDLSELRMLPAMDDTLYEVFSPHLTVSPVSLINVNTIQKTELLAIFGSLISEEEVEEFFKYRDDQEKDQSFQEIQAFEDYIKKNFASFANDPEKFTEWQTQTKKSGIFLTTNHEYFKISIVSQVNQSIRNLEAWVLLTDPEEKKQNQTASPNPFVQNPPSGKNSATNLGIQVVFMRNY